MAVGAQFGWPRAEKKPTRKREDDNRKHSFDDVLMAARKKQNAKRNTEKGRQKQPARAAKVYLLPVLNDNDGGDGDGEQNGERSGNSNGNAEGEQGNGNQGFAEAKCGPNQSGTEHNCENVEKSGVHGDSSWREGPRHYSGDGPTGEKFRFTWQFRNAVKARRRLASAPGPTLELKYR